MEEPALRVLSLLILFPLIAASGVAALQVPLGGPDVTLPREGAPAPEAVSTPSHQALDYLLQLPERLHEPGYLHEAMLAQIAHGTGVPAPIAAARNPLYGAEPQRALRDYRLVCDLNADGTSDLLSNDWDIDFGYNQITAINGREGKFLWSRDNLHFFDLSAVTGGIYPARSGLPQPQFPQNFVPQADLNGDGVCDVLAYGLTWEAFNAVTTRAIHFTFHVNAINGKNGQDLWNRQVQGEVVSTSTPAPGTIALQVLNFPTGLRGVESAEGPRFVLKTTDIVFTFLEDNLVTGVRVFDYRVTDHVTLADARTSDDVWLTTLPPDGNAQVTNFTWISDVADLDADGHPEVVLDQYWIRTPRGNQQLDDPLTGRPTFRYGQGMSVLVLAGADGTEYWRALVLDEGPVRVNLQTEEPFQILVWTYAKVIPDAWGDGVPDVVALYLSIEVNDDGTPNGRYRTHVHPLSGADGSRVWSTDPQFRGWGYLAPLNTGPDAVPLLALGTVDVPIRGEILPGGRFPAKYVQLRALNAEDGTPKWTYEERYGQDNYLPYHLALFQYQNNLAPHDWDGDGIRDLVTPARYVRPEGLHQVLVSTSTHEYQILSGRTGDVLHTVAAWGPLGQALHCPGAQDQLTILSGHARRIDVTRFHADGTVAWRTPLFNDGLPQAASRGADFVYLNAACFTTPAEEARHVIALNAWRVTPLRGFEIVPILTYLDDEGTIDWLQPELDPDPGILSFFDLLPDPPQTNSVAASTSVNASPVVLGLVAGLGAGVLRNRARRQVILE